MKKLLSTLMVIACLALAIPAQAQIKFGVKGGLNVSKLHLSEETFKSDNKTGFFIGPTAEFTLPLLGLGIDASALYNQFGVDSEEGTSTKKSIEIPINLRWTVGFSSLIGVYIATGPQYSWYIGDKNFGLNGDGESLGDIVAMNTSSFSWNVGVGINAFSHLQLGVTYNIPLGNTAEIDGLSTLKKMDVKNNNWQVRVAYMF